MATKEFHPLIVELDELYDELHSDYPTRGVAARIVAIQDEISAKLFELEAARVKPSVSSGS